MEKSPFRAGRAITYRGIAPFGFEPKSRDPESPMIDHYTTGLFCNHNVVCYHIMFSLITVMLLSGPGK